MYRSADSISAGKAAPSASNNVNPHGFWHSDATQVRSRCRIRKRPFNGMSRKPDAWLTPPRPLFDSVQLARCLPREDLFARV